MLAPIPARILRSTAEVDVCTGVDLYQHQTFAHYTVEHVHLQPTAEIRKDKTNTDQQLRSVLFVDARRSDPHLDWQALFERAHAAGGDMLVTVRGQTYTVMTVDALREADDRLHHYEVGCV